MSKGKLAIRNGYWFGVVEEKDGWRTWAPITAAKNTPLMKDVLSCYRLARWYFEAEILGKLVEFGFRENGTDTEKIAFPKDPSGLVPC